MKNGKNPTREQKKLLKQWRLNVENWLVCKDTPEAMVIVHRFSGSSRTIPKRIEEE